MLDDRPSGWRDPLAAGLAVAGLAAPVVFMVVVLAQGLLRPDYSHVALPISALAAFPGNPVQNLNFVVTGVLMTAYAIGLHLGVRPGPGGAIGPALLVLSGLGLVVTGFVPWRQAEGAFVEPPGHVAGAVMVFVGAGSGLVVTARRMAGDLRWRSVAAVALGGGLAVLVLFAAFVSLALPEGAPLHPWMGLVQRVLIAAWFACTLVLAVRLRRVAAAGRE